MMKKILDIWNKTADFARRAWAIAMHRPKALFLVGIILGSFLGHSISVMMTEARYQLSNGSIQLIGEVNPSLANKLKLDKNAGAYRFNADAITPEMTGESDPAKVAALLASQKRQTGGGGKETQNLYSLDLPIDPSQGAKIYDINSKTSFKLIPEFEMGLGRTEQGRVVYPLDEGGQAVYTVKANGIKEDIVLQKSRGDKLDFKYRLELPKTLEARLDDRGNLGIYSVDPMVSNAIAGALQNGASSADSERLKDVQENGTKDFLTYLIPAPTIVQSGNQPKGHSAKAMYKLDKNQLTVETVGLEALTYPISIDPTVVVTSMSDFKKGNNESGVSFEVDSASRVRPTAGTTGAWSPINSFTTARSEHSSAAYNGYLYVIGGSISGTVTTNVQYAPINSDGTIGTWVNTTNIPANTENHTSVAYNGYMYIVGGQNTSTVRYSPIASNGTLGSWTTTTALSEVRKDTGGVAYNGYLYITGGANSGETVSYSDVQYAPINANGTLGTWSATSSFTDGRFDHATAVYNGYMYIFGGSSSSGSRNDVQYAPINANGTLGTWSATSSFTGIRYGLAGVAFNGYLYVVGGNGVTTYNDVQYARINANGTLGTWSATSSFTTARYDHTVVAYGDYLYVMGGGAPGMGLYNDVQMANINTVPDPTLTMSSWLTTTILGAGSGNTTARATTRYTHSSVAYGGYLYLIGGQAGTTPTATVHYAPINANGTLGAWVASTAPLPAARHSHKSVVVNGYIYVFGGTVSGAASNTILYSLIGANGLNGGWTSVTPSGISSQNQGVAEHNGYLYVLGGGAGTNTVHYSLIGANGVPGTWTATTVLPVTLNSHSSVAYNGYLYAMGGSTSGGTNVDVYYAPINANGTVGAWSTTTALSFPAVNDMVHVYEGHMIINSDSKLRDGSFTEFDAVVLYAKINANGTIGTWTEGTGYTNDRDGKGSAVYNGYIYTTGGRANSVTQGDALYAQITYGRPGTDAFGTVSSWQTATATNLAVYGQAAAVHEGFIYLVGGYGGAAYRNDVRYAPINANGTIGTWTTSPNVMTMPRFNGTAIAYKGYLYAIGGQQGSGAFTNTIEYAPINTDGTVGSWTASANTFGTARYGHTSVVYNGKIYVLGGGDSANVALGDVKYTTIGTNGTVGAWADTTATTAARDTDGFIYGGRIYILGGLDGSTYFNTVRYATINSDGTLTTWTTSASTFTNARSRHATVAVNGYMYVSGGGTSSPLGDLQYAQIMSDGSLGTWKSTNSHSAVSGAPAAFYYHNIITYGGRLYTLAGIEGTGTAQSASYLTSMNVTPLTARYTQQFDLGQESTLSSVVMNGVLPVDQSNLMFRVAGADGVYGPWQLPSSLVGTPALNVRYVMYRIILDDSMSSDVFSLTGRSMINDVTIDYILPSGLTTDNRLRNNKYFNSSGVLQPLQTQ